MPELPEVETIKEDLRELVVGSTVERAEVPYPTLVEQPSVEEFARRLEGVRITGARRRAKHLIVELDSGDSLVFQLKIGGQLLLVPPVEEPESALMLVLDLDGDRRLFLRDETGFTRARLLDPGELEERLASLGPEPLEEEFDTGYLQRTVGSRRAQIKPLLLDQKVVSGIGNIYADEILFQSRIHPTTQMTSLGDHDLKTLYEQTQVVCEKAIDAGVHVDRMPDSFLLRHRQEGTECPRCGTPIDTLKVSSRTAFYCPVCQQEA
jgi:formamidopyrimidine-DNA glycosylase